VRCVCLNDRSQRPALLTAIAEGSVIYCGRSNAHFGLKGSALGNPCSIPSVACPVCGVVHYPSGRANAEQQGQSVQCYRKWLWKKLNEHDAAVVDAINQLNCNSVLACWCVADDAPEATERCHEVCHTQVIAKAHGWYTDWQGSAVE